MTILGTFEKQSGDTQDYDISFVDWLTKLNDTGLFHTCHAEDGIELFDSVLENGVVKVWLRGGVHNKRYKITAVLTTSTSPPRIKEAEIMIRVKDY